TRKSIESRRSSAGIRVNHAAVEDASDASAGSAGTGQASQACAAGGLKAGVENFEASRTGLASGPVIGLVEGNGGMRLVVAQAIKTSVGEADVVITEGVQPANAAPVGAAILA